ncbi:MAG: hypothetical protein AAF390_06025 [Pseudomonadota bacterium]
MSTLLLLFVAELAFLFWIGFRGGRPAFEAAVAVGMALAVWGAVSATMALRGTYETPGFLATMPGLWLPAVPFAVVGATLIVPGIRKGLLRIADTTPTHWLVAVQALRIAALGTLIKTAQGTFPLEVELAIGVTDLAFGLSGLALFGPSRRGALSADALAIWHLSGMAIILLPGMVAIQSGLPGPWRVFHNAPTSEVMLDWPMVMAPSLVVPCFLLLNLLGAVAAFRHGRIAAPIEGRPE